jgi:hypothetical protein
MTPSPDRRDHRHRRRIGGTDPEAPERSFPFLVQAFQRAGDLIHVCTENSDTDVMVMQSTEESI